MSARCANPLPDERLLEYLCGELSPEQEGPLEDHVFGCAACAAEAEKIAGLVAIVHRLIPAVLTRSRFEGLASAGLVSASKAMTPGKVAEVVYPPSGQVLVLRLGGADLGRAARLDVELRTAQGASIGRMEGVPFDASAGEVLVACQRHFAESYPSDVVFVLEVVSGEARRRVGEYTVLHRLA
ncbi:MAG: hypothetical protein AB7O37_21890 [Vicinamibacteria bacterium]